MMGKKVSQTEITVIDIEALIPENHLVKQINRYIDFNYIYELMEPYYSTIGRKSIDPVSLIKMLLVGFLYGIKSERRLVEEVSYNLAYRWFCGFALSDKIPDHSLFSQNRKRRFTDSAIFKDIFNQIVRMCVEKGIVTGDKAVGDGTFIPSEVSKSSLHELTEQVERNAVNYLDELDKELRQEIGYREPVPTTEEKTTWESTTDPDCGYIDQERKQGIGYLSEMTVDTKYGIILGVDCFPANQRESSVVLRHIEKIQNDTGVSIKNLALDAGYDVGAVHRGLELLGVTGFVSCIEFHNDLLKREAKYLPELDCFECPEGKRMEFIKLVYKKSTKNYYRLYRMPLVDRKKCQSCKHFRECVLSYSAAKITASAYYPAFYRNRQRYETPEYKAMKRIRGIWAEGAFAVLKREHNLSSIKKRGIHRATEECLLSALALNLKRIVKAMNKLDILFITTVSEDRLTFAAEILNSQHCCYRIAV